MKINNYQYKQNSWFPNNLEIPDNGNTLVFVFGDTNFPNSSDLLKQIQSKCNNAKLIGCSTAGEIFGSNVEDNSLSVAVTSFEKTNIRSYTAKINSSSDSRAAGKEIASRLAGPGLKGIYLLSDGLNVNGTDLVSGLTEILPDNVVISGGLAADGSSFKDTWVLTNDSIENKQIVAIGFYGSDVIFSHGSQGGWDTFGPSRLITRSVGNILFELDGKPALQIYKEYLGDRAKDLPAAALLFPLSLTNKPGEDSNLVRTILSIDEETQSLTFAGDVPEGKYATFMRANFDRLVDGAENAAANANQESNGDILCLAVSCVGRRLVLGERTEEEVEAVCEALPKNTKVVGFYSYGEISPSESRPCELHNQTMTITTISEKDS